VADSLIQIAGENIARSGVAIHEIGSMPNYGEESNYPKDDEKNNDANADLNQAKEYAKDRGSDFCGQCHHEEARD
jgi:hypothetical protein